MRKESRTRKVLNNLFAKNNKGALEISFGWLFAIIAGIVIIFLAIYLSTRIIHTEQETKSAEIGKEIGILLNPLETSFETAQTTSITIPIETRINNLCDSAGIFGKQIILLDQKSLNKWTRTDIDVFFYNKYIFSEDKIEGKQFYIFSKPLEFPFKVADLMFVTTSSERYCFVDSPEEIKEEISDLNQKNLIIEDCLDSDIKVCFYDDYCDINVDYSAGIVEKNSKIVYFDKGNDVLMYAGIFSSKEIYECQLKRIMLRIKELAILYADKEIISKKNLDIIESNIGSELRQFGELAENLKSSSEIEIIREKSNQISDKNDRSVWQLW